MRSWDIKIDGNNSTCSLTPPLVPGVETSGAFADKQFTIRWEPTLHALFIKFSNEPLERVVRLRNFSCETSSQELSSTVTLSLSGYPGAHIKLELSPHGQDIFFRQKKRSNKGSSLKSPMTGKVIEVLKSQGEPVKQGEVIAIIEAMKMENKIESQQSGILETLNISKGDVVQVGATIAIIKQGNSS